jgi:hypothetical protein
MFKTKQVEVVRMQVCCQSLDFRQASPPNERLAWAPSPGHVHDYPASQSNTFYQWLIPSLVAIACALATQHLILVPCLMDLPAYTAGHCALNRLRSRLCRNCQLATCMNRC